MSVKARVWWCVRSTDRTGRRGRCCIKSGQKVDFVTSKVYINTVDFSVLRNPSTVDTCHENIPCVCVCVYRTRTAHFGHHLLQVCVWFMFNDGRTRQQSKLPTTAKCSCTRITVIVVCIFPFRWSSMRTWFHLKKHEIAMTNEINDIVFPCRHRRNIFFYVSTPKRNSRRRQSSRASPLEHIDIDTFYAFKGQSAGGSGNGMSNRLFDANFIWTLFTRDVM